MRKEKFAKAIHYQLNKKLLQSFRIIVFEIFVYFAQYYVQLFEHFKKFVSHKNDKEYNQNWLYNV